MDVSPLALLRTFIFSATPVFELRGGLPWAIFREGLPWPAALAAALLGNFLPVLPIYLGIRRAETILARHRLGRRFFDWLYARTGRRARRLEYSRFFGLVVFVGLPLPITGAWTGTLAARLLGIPLRKTLLAVGLGIIMAGVLVTLVCLGLERGWDVVSPALARLLLKVRPAP